MTTKKKPCKTKESKAGLLKNHRALTNQQLRQETPPSGKWAAQAQLRGETQSHSRGTATECTRSLTRRCGLAVWEQELGHRGPEGTARLEADTCTGARTSLVITPESPRSLGTWRNTFRCAHAERSASMSPRRRWDRGGGQALSQTDASGSVTRTTQTSTELSAACVWTLLKGAGRGPFPPPAGALLCFPAPRWRPREQGGGWASEGCQTEDETRRAAARLPRSLSSSPVMPTASRSPRTLRGRAASIPPLRLSPAPHLHTHPGPACISSRIPPGLPPLT